LVIALMIAAIFVFDLVRRWWRETEWKRRRREDHGRGEAEQQPLVEPRSDGRRWP
jgi:uncharacterized protein affecting Mg2+/Co2+ transport